MKEREKLPLNVLIVDDEPNIRFLLKLVVERAGMTVVGMAATGAAALTYYRRYKPDLILMDIDMPMKSGLEALAELMNDHSEANVIMMSSYIDEEVVTRCFKMGAMNFILKMTPIEQIQDILCKTGRDLISRKTLDGNAFATADRPAPPT